MSDIKIVVGADVSQATSGLRAVQGELGKTASVSNIATKAFSRIGSSIGSLAGALISGGILTGITLIGVSLVEAFTKSSRAAEANAKAMEAARKEYEKIIAPIAAEVSQVATLVESFKKENLSREQKINIINQLQKLSPEYFGNLNKEKTSIDELTLSYDAYSRSLLRAVELKIRENQLTKAIERRLELQDKGNRLTTITTDENGKLRKSYNVVFDEAGTAQKGFNSGLLLTQAETKELNNLLKTEKELIGQISNLKQPQDFNKITKPVKIKVELDPINTEHFTKFLGLDNKLTAGELKIKERPKLIIQPDIKFIVPSDEVANKLRDFLKKLELEKLSEEASKIIQESAVSAIVGVGDAIGDALAGKGNFFGNVFSAIFKALGAGIRQLGVYAVTTSKLIVDLKASIGTTLGIAGGLALIALGTLISAAASKIQGPKFAAGVRNFQGGFATVGERGPERVFLPRGSSVQPNNEMMAYAGAAGSYIAETRISGTDLVILLRRGEQQMSRNN